MPTTINVEYVRPYKRHATSATESIHPSPPAPTRADGGQLEWEVEAIVDYRDRRGRKEYRVKWKGHPTPTWQPVRDVEGCPQLIQEYWDQQAARSAAED